MNGQVIDSARWTGREGEPEIVDLPKRGLSPSISHVPTSLLFAWSGIRLPPFVLAFLIDHQAVPDRSSDDQPHVVMSRQRIGKSHNQRQTVSAARGAFSFAETDDGLIPKARVDAARTVMNDQLKRYGR